MEAAFNLNLTILMIFFSLPPLILQGGYWNCWAGVFPEHQATHPVTEDCSHNPEIEDWYTLRSAKMLADPHFGNPADMMSQVLKGMAAP